jgi:DNA-binding transcriptional LysR family regulator
MDRFTQIEFFVLTAETGSLSKAAEKLNMSNAAASRTLNALEERLGARLVERTTRRLWLTDAGRDYHRRCSTILAEMAEADSAAGDAALNPRGTLRVTSSVSFAMMHIAPWLPEFSLHYPELSVQIVAANRYPDFIEAGIDVAIRTREHEGDSGITVRRLAETRRILAASPGYLARHGRPKTPEDLAGHRMLVYNLALDPYVLHLTRGEESRDDPDHEHTGFERGTGDLRGGLCRHGHRHSAAVHCSRRYCCRPSSAPARRLATTPSHHQYCLPEQAPSARQDSRLHSGADRPCRATGSCKEVERTAP